jgi:predicted outer membrane repeat protein
MSKSVFSCKWILFAIILMICNSTFADKIIYVDDDATSSNNGSSWQNAYKYLQDALTDANAAEKPVEIRVAQGIYKPDRGAGITLGNRNASFQLINNVTLSGGYAGILAPDPNDRDIKTYETILSGDLAGNDIDVNNIEDLLIEPTRKENSFHVVMSTNNNDTSKIEGFNITGGNASYGGGLYNSYSSPSIINCKFLKNSALEGGGIYTYSNSNATFTSCIISGNIAQHNGGGMYIAQSITLIDCILSNNLAGNDGGGIHNEMSMSFSFTFTNCTFNENKAKNNGGGISSNVLAYISHTIMKFNNCTFRRNTSNSNGGSIYNYGTDSTLMNCKFIENSGRVGGGIYNYESNTILIQNTFKDNTAEFGGGIYNLSSLNMKYCLFIGNSANSGSGIDNLSNAIINQSTFGGNMPKDNNCITLNSRGSRLNINNCIIRGNISAEYYSDIMINYSDIENEWLGYGTGNINADPLFADPNNGDYHLKSQAGRFDQKTQSWVIDTVTSPCIDAGDPGSPVGSEPAPNGERINMGYYGGTSEASKSYFDKPR